MSKEESLSASSFIECVEYDRETGAYKYTDHKSVKGKQRGKPIRQYNGYLWVNDNFYSRIYVDQLYAPYKGATLSHKEYADSQSPTVHYMHKEVRHVHFPSLHNSFETARGMAGQLHPTSTELMGIKKKRDKTIVDDFLARKQENDDNAKYNEAPDSVGFRAVKSVNKIIADMADEYGMSTITVRNILGKAGVVTEAMLEGKKKPLTTLRPEYKFFIDSYPVIVATARAYYTGAGYGARVMARGFGGNRIAPGFFIDLTKMLYESEGVYQPPLECQVTLQPFNEESMRDPKKKQHRWNDIVIGRLDVRKPAHYENLAFMTRLARDVMEGQHKYSSWAKKAWEKLNCTEEQWREAMEKTEYGVTKFMEGLKR